MELVMLSFWNNDIAESFDNAAVIFVLTFVIDLKDGDKHVGAFSEEREEE